MLTVLLTGVVAVLVFGTVVLVHEAGHFLAARRCGIYVQEFSIGFGPAVWTRVKNGTRYSVRLFPVGGYNAMPGEENTVEESETENPDEPPRPGHRPYDRHAPVLPTAVQGKYFDEATPGLLLPPFPLLSQRYCSERRILFLYEVRCPDLPPQIHRQNRRPDH